MPDIRKEFQGQTIITTFETTPALCFDLIEALEAAYAQVIRFQPGFQAAALHVNDARTRVCNYSQWQSRKDFQAMLRTPEMRERNKQINDLCRGFEPVMYDVIDTY